MFFFNRVNSRLKDRKEKTECNIKTIDSPWNKQYLFVKHFSMRLFFLTIPKLLKQYTLFKKNYPFRFF
jgi:hypothetical protein